MEADNEQEARDKAEIGETETELPGQLLEVAERVINSGPVAVKE